MVLPFYSISLTQPDFTEVNVPVTQAAAVSKAHSAVMLSQLHTQDMHTACQGGVHCQASHCSFIFSLGFSVSTKQLAKMPDTSTP